MIDRYKYLITAGIVFLLFQCFGDMVVSYIAYTHPQVKIVTATKTIVKTNIKVVTHTVIKPSGETIIDTTTEDHSTSESVSNTASTSTPVFKPMPLFYASVGYALTTQSLEVGGGVNFYSLSFGVSNPVRLALEPKVQLAIRF